MSAGAGVPYDGSGEEPIRRRPRAREWRVTRTVEPFIFRFWLEADQTETAFIGTDEGAERYVDNAMTMVSNEPGTMMELAQRLSDLIPAANSVEVCDDQGSGACVHRDWP